MPYPPALRRVLAATASTALSAAVLGAAEPPLSATTAVCPALPTSTAPATGAHTWWEIDQIARLGTKRYLALLRTQAARVDRWADAETIEAERRISGGVATASLESVDEAPVVAVISEDGRLLRRSSGVRPPTPAAGEAGGRTQVAPPLLVALEEDDACPYLLLAGRSPKLQCYDL